MFVDGTAVDWGSYDDATHSYSVTVPATTAGLALMVSDTYYGDNVGSLSYTVTYVGM